MEKTYHSLKDFELSYGKNAIERANDFQQYIEQLDSFGCKSYWITSHTGIGSTMAIEGFNEPIIAFISNDYLGMSQREETKQAGIDAIKKIWNRCLCSTSYRRLSRHTPTTRARNSFLCRTGGCYFIFFWIWSKCWNTKSLIRSK